MTVLMCAYACRPEAGSEEGVGWAFAEAAGRVADVLLLTRTANAPWIEPALKRDPLLKITPVYVDLPSALAGRKRPGRFERSYYLAWILLARRRVRALEKGRMISVGHHVTFASDYFPTPLSALAASVPLIWGPVGGAGNLPWRLWRWLGLSGSLKFLVRLIVTGSLRRIFGRPTARRAALTIAQHPGIVRALGRHAKSVVVEPNVALSSRLRSDENAQAAPSPSEYGRQAIFAGRLIAMKGIHLAIQTLATPAPPNGGWTSMATDQNLTGLISG